VSTQRVLYRFFAMVSTRVGHRGRLTGRCFSTEFCAVSQPKFCVWMCLGLGVRRSSTQDAILNVMEHLEVLREKIATLSAEIVQLKELNQQYRRQGQHDTEAEVAHGQRHQRLLEIQQQLTQLARLGGRVRSVQQIKEQHRSRPFLVKKAS